ncbi:General stress protein 13 [Rubripirellula amarantea]|uniref:General stress protein 13 n=1 Tax=Rubripirellula amarantea TaxID=2527999 RepID=A0A5C5WTQ8_9BACT|nr:Tex-like N-terminal domain-containing protein [Rubripirellula amarantea]TWT53900.1 General stress protein 13 [Rubripirellula amarantea]
MSVDFEAIAQRGRCDVSSLRLALPLLEQGYTPPFLSRYRRDELGGVDEASLWALSAAVKSEQEIEARKAELQEAWRQTALSDPAIGHAINKAGSMRVLARLARRLKSESAAASSDSTHLAVRVLNPQKGDGDAFAEIAGKIEAITDVDAAVAGLDTSLAERLSGDPRMIASAVRWLSKHARIKITTIHDPHINSESGDDGEANESDSASVAPKQAKAAKESSPSATVAPTQTEAKPAAEAPDNPTPSTESPSTDAPSTEATAAETFATEATAATKAADSAQGQPVAAPEASVASVGDSAATDDATPPADAASSASDAVSSDAVSSDAKPSETVVSDAVVSDSAASEAKAEVSSKPATPAKPEKAAASKKADKKSSKKVSPRQRRRRWLVSVLKPLQGKKFAGDKLSAFQIVMLGRALRSQVAVCEFEYDAAKLVVELQRTASGFNRVCEEKLQQIVFQNEAIIREAAEAAWWDDLQERASSRLIAVTGDTLRRHINRGAIDAKVVFSIDAVGPRTAAATIVSADGKLLHSEDLPCQLSSAQRSAAVARMGELIHTYHVDLIVISNGPARRSLMVAIGDLIKQSPEKSVRWTLAERGGADAYSSSSVADQEMRSTPRRFRAAAWLAFSVLQPAQAMAKVDPLKLRLSSFQRELSDDALSTVLEDIMVSGASRGGVDVNSAPSSWLRRLPGVTETVAQAIEKRRRESLFESREAIMELEQWTSEVESRQALPFLRVFGSNESLDGTLIHPDDYPIAKKLAKSLSIELPPTSPPGYEAPDYSSATAAVSEVKKIEVVEKPVERVVEDFTASGEKSPEFSIADDPVAEPAASQTASASPTGSEAPADAASDTSETVPDQAGADKAAAEEPAVAEPAAEGSASDSPVAEESVAQEPAAEIESPEIESTDSSAETEAAAKPDAEASASAEVHERVKHSLPERSAIEKCIKEWQIGKRRTHQIVHWLCDPFGDSDSSGTPPAVMTKVPAMKELKPGDEVIGIVVGVMPFGVFVELAPDCSGLVHVSRVSDSYVEDLHEAVQVGDVVTAWVTGIEEKKRRVALSALSPQREAELAEARRSQSPQGRRGPNRGDADRGRQGGGGQARGGQSQSRDGQGQNQRGGQARGGQARGGGKPGGDRGGRGRQDSRGGGRSRDGRGGNSREKRVESYRVVAKAEAKPLTEAMVKGDEPMRSFGDLAQLFSASKKVEPKTVKPQAKPSVEASDPAPEPSASGSSSSDSTATDSTATEATTPKPAASESQAKAVTAKPDADAAEASAPESDASAS